MDNTYLRSLVKWCFSRGQKSWMVLSDYWWYLMIKRASKCQRFIHSPRNYWASLFHCSSCYLGSRPFKAVYVQVSFSHCSCLKHYHSLKMFSSLGLLLLLSALAMPVYCSPASPVNMFQRAACNADNCLRALRNPTDSVTASKFCSAYLPLSTATVYSTTTTTPSAVVSILTLSGVKVWVNSPLSR